VLAVYVHQGKLLCLAIRCAEWLLLDRISQVDDVSYVATEQGMINAVGGKR